MKKTLMLLVATTALFSLFLGDIFTYATDCDYRWGSLASELEGCLRGSDLVDSWNGAVESGLKNQINTWTSALAGFFWLLAVGAVVLGAFSIVVSAGDDEKLKKWKDIVKWGLIGFFALVIAGALVKLVIELVFSVAR